MSAPAPSRALRDAAIAPSSVPSWVTKTTSVPARRSFTKWLVTASRNALRASTVGGPRSLEELADGLQELLEEELHGL
jgi:hypothetical protein